MLHAILISHALIKSQRARSSNKSEQKRLTALRRSNELLVTAANTSINVNLLFLV